MTELDARISQLLDSPERDPDSIDRALTDGFAHVLTLETERLRLERRLSDAVLRLRPADGAAQTDELSELASQLSGNAGALGELRGQLGRLRRLRA
jgi:hypothetical protein